MLNGQKLQGPETAAEVNYMLKARVSAHNPHKICLFWFAMLLNHCFRALRQTSPCSPQCTVSASVNSSQKTC